MAFTKMMILRMLNNAGGITNEYPFIEMGQFGHLNALLKDGFVEMASGQPFRIVKITKKGLDALASDTSSDPVT